MADVWIKTLAIAGIAALVSIVIAVVIRVIVSTLGRLESPTAQPAAPTAAAPSRLAGPPAAHVAAIAAAVHAVLGSHRIVHIEENRRRVGWLAEGRLAQHSSHGPEHHPRH